MALRLEDYEGVAIQPAAGPVAPQLDWVTVRLTPAPDLEGSGVSGPCSPWLPAELPLLAWDRGHLVTPCRPRPVGELMRSRGGACRLVLEGQLWRVFPACVHYDVLRAVVAAWIRAVGSALPDTCGVSLSRIDYAVSVECSPELAREDVLRLVPEIGLAGARLGLWNEWAKGTTDDDEGSWTVYVVDKLRLKRGRAIVRLYHPVGVPWLRVEVENRALTESRAGRVLHGLVEVMSLADQLREAQLRSAELISASLAGSEVVWQFGDRVQLPILGSTRAGRSSPASEQLLRAYGHAWSASVKCGHELPREVDQAFLAWAKSLDSTLVEGLRGSAKRARQRLRLMRDEIPSPDVTSLAESAELLLQARRPAPDIYADAGWEE